MVNYANSKIYKIYPISGEDECYIGSTVNSLCRRMAGHREEYKRQHDMTITSKILFNKYGINNCKIQLLELCPCDTKEQLHAREGYHIRNNNCVNKNIPNRTNKEWREDNKEYLNKKKKEYYNDNRKQLIAKVKQYCKDNEEHVKNYQKQYRESNKDNNAEYQKKYNEINKDRLNEYRQQYRDNNKEIIAKRDKKYREANKEVIKLKEQIKVKCICGDTITKKGLNRHKKTKHHLQDEQDFFDGCEQALLELNNNL